ncbi:MAG: type II toxin-antitoxin system RelE/ParE family toxin [Aliidongia sp.]
MIESWASSATHRCAETGKNKFSGLDVETAYELLAALGAATSLNDLSPLKSVGLHKLDGDRRGQWAMTINGPWRHCFRFDDGKAADVEIVNYHKG